MCQIVADVAENTATEDHDRNVPVPVEDCMGELVEWCCEDEEKRRWHDESVSVHRKVVVHTV